MATSISGPTVREEVLTTAVIGSAGTTDTIATTALDAILGAVYVIVIVLTFATSGVKLCIVHTMGKYDPTLPSSPLSPVQRSDIKQPEVIEETFKSVNL